MNRRTFFKTTLGALAAAVVATAAVYESPYARAFSIGPIEGGYLVPEGFRDDFVKLLKPDRTFADLRKFARDEIVETFRVEHSLLLKHPDVAVIGSEPEEAWDEDGE